ncbi:TrkH family potassium uptake protein [Psychroflexus sediminis]|uniref:Trk system potassium uptake protein TrkH n=1 Tax=Psychroflexus sediminis TaxID=470826 RepID=A0A1G7XCD0_9FLAO|nr:TrkH family potassium uptake protein [Psychroflexus sediminis]SDG81764.1 trk system potassium uptake protein TrkH [Psychroflexus sediminis]
MNKTFIKQIASLQIILGLVMLIPSVPAVIYQEWYSLSGFLIAGTFTALLGFLIYRLLKSTEEPGHEHSLAIAASGWLMIMVLGALPYLIIAWLTPAEVMQGFVPAGEVYTSSLMNFRNPLHCLFESTSAFTTTGFTMAYHEPSVGNAVLFYRSFSQWVGGAGFIVMSLAVFKSLPGHGGVLLYGSEAHGTKLRTNVIHTARAIWKVYFVITLFMVVYLAAGTYFILPEYPLSQTIFDAVNHALTGQSTGGFSTLDKSIAGYKSAKMEILYILPMLLGGLSIPFYYRFLFQRQVDELWNDLQTRSFITGSVFGGIALSLFLMYSGSVEDPFREGLFQFVSAMSTTGWQTSDIDAWDNTSVLFVVAGAMIIGGCAGGTVGGIKIIRAQLLQKGLRWYIHKIFYPKSAINTVKFNGKRMLPEEMKSELVGAGLFTFIYMLFLFFSTLLTLFFMEGDFTLSDAIFEAASAQGTVGLSSGMVSPGMSPVIESVYIVQMWTGRIEIIPVLVLLRILVYGTKPKII